MTAQQNPKCFFSRKCLKQLQSEMRGITLLAVIEIEETVLQKHIFQLIHIYISL